MGAGALLLTSPVGGFAQADTTRVVAPYIDDHNVQGCLWSPSDTAPRDTTCRLVTTPPTILRQPTLPYPPQLLDAGVEGRLLVELVVDTVGRVEPNSVRIALASRRDFEQPVREWIEQTAFRPAMVDGKPVRVLVRLPIVLGERRVGPTEMPSEALIAQARAQLGRGKVDSAAAVLAHVVEAPARAPVARAQAWVLLGIAKFYAGGDSAAKRAFGQALVLDPGLQVSGLDQFDPDIARLFDEARVAGAAADSTRARPAAGAPATPPIYDCLVKCPEGVVGPRFTYFPRLIVLEGQALPARRSHAFVVMQAVVSEAGLVEPESIRLVSGTAVGEEGQLRQALPLARFRPGLAEGVAARTRVQLRFDFHAEGTGMIGYSYQVVGR